MYAHFGVPFALAEGAEASMMGAEIWGASPFCSSPPLRAGGWAILWIIHRGFGYLADRLDLLDSSRKNTFYWEVTVNPKVASSFVHWEEGALTFPKLSTIVYGCLSINAKARKRGQK